MMDRLGFQGIAASLMAICALSFVSGTDVRAHEYMAKGLKIDHPWAKPTPGASKVGAVYMKLVNASDNPDVLVAASSDIAQRIEIHESTIVDNVAKMREITDGLMVPANGTVELGPMGLHLMVFGLKQPLKDGDAFDLELSFRDRGLVQVVVKVEAGAATTKPHRGSSSDDAGSHDHHH